MQKEHCAEAYRNFGTIRGGFYSVEKILVWVLTWVSSSFFFRKKNLRTALPRYMKSGLNIATHIAFDHGGTLNRPWRGGGFVTAETISNHGEGIGRILKGYAFTPMWMIDTNIFPRATIGVKIWIPNCVIHQIEPLLLKIWMSNWTQYKAPPKEIYCLSFCWYTVYVSLFGVPRLHRFGHKGPEHLTSLIYSDGIFLWSGELSKENTWAEAIL